MNPFQLADSVRYIDDTRFKLRTKKGYLDNFENDLALNSIKITKELTPELHITINEVCKNLYLDPKIINAYINHSIDINAGCINDSTDKCIVTLTSPLVNMLTINELNFTIGHELGHFLLNHCIEDWVNDDSQESLIKRRAQEISCDRIGLIACKNFDVSIKSIVKSLSGLNGKYLTYDMRSFLNQLDNIDTGTHSSSQFSTHPAFLLRVKALLRFSISDKYLSIQAGTQNGGTPLHEVDKLIQKDLNKYVDNRIRDDIKISKENVLFWGYVSVFVSDAKFTKKEQEYISDNFGSYKLDQLNKMLASIKSPIKIIDEIKDRLISAISKFINVNPNRANKIIISLLMEIEKDTKNNGFFDDLIKEIL